MARVRYPERIEEASVTSKAIGAGDAIVPPDLGRFLNPISTRGTDYAHHITTGSTGFSDLPTALKRNNLLHYLNMFLRISTQYRDLYMDDNPVNPATLDPYLRQFTMQNQVRKFLIDTIFP